MTPTHLPQPLFLLNLPAPLYASVQCTPSFILGYCVLTMINASRRLLFRESSSHCVVRNYVDSAIVLLYAACASICLVPHVQAKQLVSLRHSDYAGVDADLGPFD